MKKATMIMSHDLPITFWVMVLLSKKYGQRRKKIAR